MMARWPLALILLNAVMPTASDAQRRGASLARPSAAVPLQTPHDTRLRPDRVWRADTVKSRGWPTAAKVLVGEASIALLSSAGYLARAGGWEPERGAKELGMGLLGGGVTVGIFVLGFGVVPRPEDKGLLVLLIACGAAMVAGSYDVYLAANQDPPRLRSFGQT